jgi:hypothetical protein
MLYVQNRGRVCTNPCAVSVRDKCGVKRMRGAEGGWGYTGHLEGQLRGQLWSYVHLDSESAADGLLMNRLIIVLQFC